MSHHQPVLPLFALPRTLLLAMVYSSLSGLLSGYQMGISGGALKSLQSSSLEISSSQVGRISSIYFVGLMIAAPGGGYAVDKLGRRACILYMDGLLFLGAVLLTVAPNYSTILAGRFIVGCATAVSLVAAVSYLTELASVHYHHHQHHSHHRGALVLSVQASIALGFLVSYLASYALSVTNSENTEGGEWRLLFGVGTGFMALAQWMGMKQMPESPHWLTMKGCHEKAQMALSRFSTNLQEHGSSSGISDVGGENTSPSMRATAIAARGLRPLEQTLQYGEVTRMNETTSPTLSRYWRQAVIIAVLAVAEQFCGHINVLNYAPVIFAEVFYNEDEQKASKNGDEIALVILGVVKFLITIFVLFSVDKLGRLFFLKTGATIVTVSLLFVAVSLSFSWEETLVTASGDIEHVHSTIQDILVLVGCTGIVTGFALSYGPIVWLIASELSPSSIRGRMLGFFAVLTHGGAALVTFTFLSDQEKYGDSIPFWIYFVCSLAGLAFIFVAVPETEGVDGCEYEDVENLLDAIPFWGKNSWISCCFASCSGYKHSEREITRQDSRIDLCFDDVVDSNSRLTFT